MDTSGSSTTSKIFSMEGVCECLYDSLRCCKILDASLKLGTVFDRFNINLTGVKVGIRELSNDAFDRFRLGFGSSSSKKNVSFSSDSTSDFSPTVFSTMFQMLDDGSKVSFQRDIFLQFLKRNIFYESNCSFLQSAILSL